MPSRCSSLRSLIGITEGAFAGDIKNMGLGLMLTVPSILPSFFGVVVGRKGFARGLGVLHLLFGLIGVGLCYFATTAPRASSSRSAATWRSPPRPWCWSPASSAWPSPSAGDGRTCPKGPVPSDMAERQ
ncbi:hypothetical protein OV079_42345 [Nannocystis pusilla]|uniref:Uncharacterized protein n=1 Tax=Nannocystis pusilla TaxID=889268 RepID=A0A9X3EYX3_9BACT|nr:hypothetical protein [Nannocystis pusilla]MCY1012080.1 hypothetical protein [Nannocystis pusilla]